jgi:hypothetical protein
MKDEAVWTHFQGFREHVTLGRASGHRGVLSHRYCFDRAIWSAMTRRVQQLHRAQELHLAEAAPEGAGTRLATLQELVASVRCASHDCHNALKWAMSALAKDADSLRKCCILIESMRNGFGMLARYMNSWLEHVLMYEDWRFDVGVEQLWSMFGRAPLSNSTWTQISTSVGRVAI